MNKESAKRHGLFTATRHTRVPCEALTGGKVGNLQDRQPFIPKDARTVMASRTYQAGRTLRIANVDNGGLLFGDGGAYVGAVSL